MAWVSAVFGAAGGLVLAVIASVLGGWPLWLILLLYPFASGLLMLIALAVLFLRDTRGEEVSQQEESEDRSSFRPPRAALPRLF